MARDIRGPSNIYRTAPSSSSSSASYSTANGSRSKVMKDPKKPKKGRAVACLRHLKENRLVLFTLIGVFIGFIIGFAVKQSEPTDDAIMWLGMPGEIFLRCLTSMILPLIVSNVIAGSSSLDVKSNGKLGLTAIIYVIVTNLIGSAIGILLSMAIRPGSDVSGAEPPEIETEKVMKTQDLFADLVRNMFPDNMVASTFSQTQTRYHPVTKGNNTYMKSVLTSQGGTNILGVITMGFVFGMAASSEKEKGRPFRMFFESTSAIVTKVLHYLFLITPVGVASLIASSVAKIPQLTTLFTSLGKFAATVSAGLAIHMFLLIPICYVVVFRRNPLRFLGTCIRPCIIGFTFTSGSAALPEMEYCLVKKNNVDNRVGRAILPLIVTLNADGSSLFIVTAAMFIAQHAAVTLNIGNIIALAFLTAISTLAIPGIPSSSIVALVLLLTSMNIPTEAVAMLYAIEWLLDRLRTSCNVLSHILGSMLVFHFCKSQLPPELPGYHDDDDDDDDDGDEMSEMTATTAVTNSATTPVSEVDDHSLKAERPPGEANGLLLPIAENVV